MTDLIKFTLKYPDKIKYYGLNLKFHCGEIITPLCSVCPNEAKSDACNHFTKQEMVDILLDEDIV